MTDKDFNKLQESFPGQAEQNTSETDSSVYNRILQNLAYALTDHEAFEMSQWYIDITDGTVISLPSGYQMLGIREDADIPQWQKDRIRLLKMYEKHDKIMINPIPSYVSFRIMEDFASSFEPRHQTPLFNALEKRHPFARFRQSVERLGLLEKWYDFKNKSEIQMTEKWLEDNDLTIQNGKIVRIDA